MSNYEGLKKYPLSNNQYNAIYSLICEFTTTTSTAEICRKIAQAGFYIPDKFEATTKEEPQMPDTRTDEITPENAPAYTLATLNGELIIKSRHDHWKHVDAQDPFQIIVYTGEFRDGNFKVVRVPVAAGGDPEVVATEDTMAKVYLGLFDQGLSEDDVVGAVSRMQNRGIKFREVADA